MGVNLLNTKAKDPTEAVFGVDNEGNVFKAALSEGPHWIVAGQSGSGKSVYMNSILASMMYHALPQELIIMAIDPKMVEFGPYKGLPFCPVDPVTNMNDAYALLGYLVYEMDRRYNDNLKGAGVRNIKDYNKWVEDHPTEAAEKGFERLPFIICVIDEYADMIMTTGPETSDLIIRLAQKARAAGITCLIATQRPSADIISPTIKANVPARIGLKTTDTTNSMIIIDEAGCEKLNGYGDSIVKLTDGAMHRVQGPFISDAELYRVFDELKSKFPPPEILDYKQICVDLGIAEWEEEYGDDVPYEDRHVVKPKRRRMF